MTRSRQSISSRSAIRRVVAAAIPALVAGTLVLLLSLAPVTPPASAREIHEDETIATRITDVRRALALEEYERAIGLAEELFAEYPEDLAVFWALARTYAQAGRDRDDLIPLLTDYLTRNPGDRRATMELGSALAREGRADEAHAMWIEPMREREVDLGGYSEVGSLEVRHRMFEYAIETYLEGRARAGQDHLFSQELARAYAATGQNEEVIAECLNAVIANPGMVQWGMNMVEGVLETSGDRALVERWATSIAGRENARPQELSFAGSLYALVGRMDEALEAHTLSDQLGGRRGMELLEYARLVRDRGMLAEAERALAVLFELYPAGAAAAAAGSERAGILVELGDPVGAVSELKRLAGVFAGRPDSYAALIEAAEIELHELDDPAAALTTLEAFRINTGGIARPTLHRAGLVEVDARLARDELDLAYRKAGAIVAGGAEDETAERARYVMGLVSFLRGEHAAAVTELREMVESFVGGRLANDAIRLMLIVSDAMESGDEEQASLYASALKAEVTGDIRTATEILDTVATRFAGMTVASEALLRLGSLTEARGELREALDVYARALGESESIAVKAEARLRRGRIMKTMRGREDDAIREFGALLEELPPNHLSGEARRELESLRRKGASE